MALFDTNSGLGGLLGDFSDYGFGVPRNTGGLVADPERDAINKRALLSGLISAGLTYAATPKNLNTGSAIPYLGKAGLAGFNTSQDVVDRSLNMAYRNKLFAGRDDIFSNINPLDVTPESLQMYIQGGKKDPSLLRKAAPVEKLPVTRTIKRGRQEVFQELQSDGTYKDYATSSIDPPREPKAANEMYEQKPTVDANGQTVYLPTVYGAKNKVPVLDLQGQPVKNYAPVVKGGKATEFENKAALYFKSMTTASKTLDSLEDLKTSQDGNPVASKSVFVSGYEQFNPSETLTQKNRSPQRKSYVQAQKQWIDSINRVRSGANLPEIEYNRAVATFFPIYGDADAEVAQKSLARKQEEEAMSVAGRAALKGSAQREEGVDY